MLRINYSNKKVSKLTSNLVLFSDDKFNVNLKKNSGKSEFSYIYDLIKTSDLKKNLLVFDVNSKKKIILISTKNNMKNSDVENLGAEFFKAINYGKK